MNKWKKVELTYINSFRREKEKKERLYDFDNYSIKNPIKNIYFLNFWYVFRDSESNRIKKHITV